MRLVLSLLLLSAGSACSSLDTCCDVTGSSPTVAVNCSSAFCCADVTAVDLISRDLTDFSLRAGMFADLPVLSVLKLNGAVLPLSALQHRSLAGCIPAARLLRAHTLRTRETPFPCRKHRFDVAARWAAQRHLLSDCNLRAELQRDGGRPDRLTAQQPELGLSHGAFLRQRRPRLGAARLQSKQPLPKPHGLLSCRN